MAVVALLLAIFTVGNTGQSQATLRDTTSGEILAVEAASIKAVHSPVTQVASVFHANKLINTDAVTLTNTGTIAADFTVTTSLVGTPAVPAFKDSVTVTLWRAQGGDCTVIPAGPVSGKWGAPTFALVSAPTAPLKAGESTLVCVRTELLNLTGQANKNTSFAAKLTTTLSRSSWTSEASTPFLQTLQDFPPSAPIGLVASSTTGSSTKLTWAASTDDVRVTGYDIYRTDPQGVRSPTETTTAPEFTASGLKSESTYTFSVIARDGAGNASSAATVTITTADVTPPTAPVLSVRVSSAGTATLFWTPATDSRGISRYEVFVGSVEIGRVLNPDPAATTVGFDHSGLIAGAYYEYRVRAVDSSGLRSLYSNGVRVSLPSTALTCIEPSLPLRSAQISWTRPSSISGTPEYQILVGGKVVGTTTSLKFSLTRDLMSSFAINSDGRYNVQVRLASDGAPVYEGAIRLGLVWGILWPAPGVSCD